MNGAKVIPLRARRRFLAVSGGKGGIGKSTIALNLALSYAKLGHLTLVVDGDFGMADLNLLLGVAPDRNLLDVVSGRASLSEVLVVQHGISLLPGANGCSRLANPDRSTRRRINQVIELLRNQFETVVLDAPAGIESSAIAMTATANEVLIVATPEPLSIADAYATIKVLSHEHGVERVFLLPNQVRSPSQAKEVAEQLGRMVDHFLGTEMVVLPSIPYDAEINQDAISGLPLVLARPAAPAARAIALVARTLEAQERSREIARCVAATVTSPQLCATEDLQ